MPEILSIIYFSSFLTSNFHQWTRWIWNIFVLGTVEWGNTTFLRYHTKFRFKTYELPMLSRTRCQQLSTDNKGTKKFKINYSHQLKQSQEKFKDNKLINLSMNQTLTSYKKTNDFASQHFNCLWGQWQSMNRRKTEKFLTHICENCC